MLTHYNSSATSPIKAGVKLTSRASAPPTGALGDGDGDLVRLPVGCDDVVDGFAAALPVAELDSEVLLEDDSTVVVDTPTASTLVEVVITVVESVGPTVEVDVSDFPPGLLIPNCVEY